MIGPQVQIRFDGVRLNNSTWRTGPVQYLNLIEPLLVDHIEVLRGPASVLYGSDAMGGVIQVFPQAPQDYRGQDTPSAHGGMTLRYAHANGAIVAALMANQHLLGAAPEILAADVLASKLP